MVNREGQRHTIVARRAAYIRHVHHRYGITLYPHPRDGYSVVISTTDHADLVEQVMNDPLLNPIGRGYYLYLGCELTPTLAPDWTCDPLTVSLARLYAVALHRPCKPVVRALTAALTRLRG